MKLKTAFLLILLVLMLLLSSCSLSSKKFEQYVRSGNKDAAISYYQKHIENNSKALGNANTFLSSFINSSIESYGEGKITFEEAGTNCDIVSYIINHTDSGIIYSVQEEVAFSYDRLNAINYSKRNHADALKAINNKDFSTALLYLYQVNADDTENYAKDQELISQVLKQFKDNVAQDVENKLQDNQYDEAMNAVVSSGILSHDEDFYETELDYIIESKINYLTTYANQQLQSEKYEDALTALDVLNADSVYFTGNFSYDLYFSLLEDSLNNYTRQLIEAGDKALVEQDYMCALDIVQKGLWKIEKGTLAEECRNHCISILEEKINEYSSYAPVLLSDLKYTEWDDISINDSYYGEDVNKVKYKSSLCLWEMWPTTGYVTYFINKEYSTLTGIIYRPYCSLGSDSGYINGKIEVYGDDVLLYESEEMTYDSYDSYDIEIDIKYVRNLTIKFYGSVRHGIGNHEPTIGLANATIQK